MAPLLTSLAPNSSAAILVLMVLVVSNKCSPCSLCHGLLHGRECSKADVQQGVFLPATSEPGAQPGLGRTCEPTFSHNFACKCQVDHCPLPQMLSQVLGPPRIQIVLTWLVSRCWLLQV